MSARLLHYSKRPLRSVKDAEPQNVAAKPDGLWVSVEGPDDWPSWCRAESFGVDHLRRCAEIVLSENAKILRIDGESALDRFTEEYGVGDGRYAPIAWPAVEWEWDGIIIAPYVRSRRFTFNWYLRVGLRVGMHLAGGGHRRGSAGQSASARGGGRGRREGHAMSFIGDFRRGFAAGRRDADERMTAAWRDSRVRPSPCKGCPFGPGPIEDKLPSIMAWRQRAGFAVPLRPPPAWWTKAVFWFIRRVQRFQRRRGRSVVFHCHETLARGTERPLVCAGSMIDPEERR